MEISKACTPPIQPHVTAADRAHPLFPIYQQHRSGCDRMLVKASSFPDWLFQYERDLVAHRAASDPRYQAFMEWMHVHKGGARPCPAGAFPHNFYFWIEGGRW